MDARQSAPKSLQSLRSILVIVALQLAEPFLDTRSMARLDARRGTPRKRTLSEANGYHNTGSALKEPGLSIGEGVLADILLKKELLFLAVGNVVSSFASGTFRLPRLEQAWCDAAYWFHTALAESIDTIAIAQLETALEVLLCAENGRGSEQRLLAILSTFFGLQPDDPVAPDSALSAQQFARKVVRDRSRILHGTWSTLKRARHRSCRHGRLRNHDAPDSGDRARGVRAL